MPDEATVARMFVELMDALALPGSAASKMIQTMTPDKKWLMIKQNAVQLKVFTLTHCHTRTLTHLHTDELTHHTAHARHTLHATTSKPLDNPNPTACAAVITSRTTWPRRRPSGGQRTTPPSAPSSARACRP